MNDQSCPKTFGWITDRACAASTVALKTLKTCSRKLTRLTYAQEDCHWEKPLHILTDSEYKYKPTTSCWATIMAISRSRTFYLKYNHTLCLSGLIRHQFGPIGMFNFRKRVSARRLGIHMEFTFYLCRCRDIEYISIPLPQVVQFWNQGFIAMSHCRLVSAKFLNIFCWKDAKGNML